jgi:hypothetical protein
MSPKSRRTATDSEKRASRARLERLVRAFRGRRIGVVGDLMLDRYLWGSADRLSPEAAVPVVDFTSESQVLGGAGNVAANLAALGAAVEVFGVIGADEAGAALGRIFAEQGIGAKGVLEDASRITTTKTRVIARHQQVVRLDRERRAPLAPALEGRLIRRIKLALPRLDALVVPDYDKGVVTDALGARACGSQSPRRARACEAENFAAVCVSRRHRHRVQLQGSWLLRHAIAGGRRRARRGGACAASALRLRGGCNHARRARHDRV